MIYAPQDIEASLKFLNGAQSCSWDILCTLMLACLRRMEKRTRAGFRGGDASPIVVCAHMPLQLKPVDVFVGASARTASQALIYPIDTLKTRIQVSATKAGPMSLGLNNLFLGFAGSMAAFVPSAVIYFGVNSMCREVTTRHNKNDDPQVARLCRLISSAASAFSSSFLRVPADVLKHRVQAYVYPTVADAASHIIGSKGVSGLYAGFGATLMRDVPEIALQFLIYEELQKVFESKNQDGTSSKASPQQHLLLGGSAGAMAAVLTNPLDVIKTNMQSGGASSLSSAVSMVMKRRGVLGLWSGAGPRVLMTTLQCATFFTLFEALGTAMDTAHAVTTVSDAPASSVSVGLNPRMENGPVPLCGYQREQHRGASVVERRQIALATTRRPLCPTTDITHISQPLALAMR